MPFSGSATLQCRANHKAGTRMFTPVWNPDQVNLNPDPQLCSVLVGTMTVDPGRADQNVNLTLDANLKKTGSGNESDVPDRTVFQTRFRI